MKEDRMVAWATGKKLVDRGWCTMAREPENNYEMLEARFQRGRAPENNYEMLEARFQDVVGAGIDMTNAWKVVDRMGDSKFFGSNASKLTSQIVKINKLISKMEDDIGDAIEGPNR